MVAEGLVESDDLQTEGRPGRGDVENYHRGGRTFTPSLPEPTIESRLLDLRRGRKKKRSGGRGQIQARDSAVDGDTIAMGPRRSETWSKSGLRAVKVGAGHT